MSTAQAIKELKKLVRASNYAWNVMMNGSESDACTIKGSEGVNYINWCASADAECAFRVQHDLCDYPKSRRSN